MCRRTRRFWRCILIYVVSSGDTVDSIAEKYAVSPNSISFINQIPYPYRLTAGQALLLTDMPEFGDSGSLLPAPSEGSGRSVYTGGYAYPFISPWVLSQTLPYLSYLYIFSYGFTGEGELIPPTLDDTWLIESALSHQTSPVLTLTPLGPDGNFNNTLISQVVNNLTARRRLKDHLISVITEKGYQGLDIDFEYILPQDRDAFTDFVSYMRESVNALGYPVSVALAPKSSGGQTGVLYEGKDYAGLGAAADYVLLMTYEWGYTYGPPMSVSPADKVREVLDYAVTVIPPEKIHLGIPNYGYDWTLPFEKGISRARTLGNIEAVQLAVANNVPIFFDTTAQSPYFYYTSQNRQHEVWYEDVRSLTTTFDFIDEYRLRGCSYWQIMQLFRANWLLLAERFEIIRPGYNSNNTIDI